MTAPSIKAGDTKTEGLWTFDRSNEWVSKYPICNKNASRISPLNIDTGKIAPCNVLCRLSVNYKPSTCSISMVNNIPTVTFSPKCIIKFKNEFLYLRKMTIHYTSLHTINSSYADLEILLYHNRNPINDSDGGIILSILMKSGKDYGQANEFMNEFINKMPSNEMKIEQDVIVSDTWCPEQLFPEGSKSFFYYDGALPYPPCTPNWTFIIFEETVPISENIINTVKYMLGTGNKNIRPIQKTPKDTIIFYNSNTFFDGTQDVSDSAIELATTPTDTSKSINNLSSTSWLKQNIYAIKGIIITLVLILMVYVAIKFAKVIVQNDLLNSFIIRQLKKKRHLEAQASQEQAAAQQAAEYGQAAPVENVSLNNNNNNDE
jgi:carbonic anhydrase